MRTRAVVVLALAVAAVTAVEVGLSASAAVVGQQATVRVAITSSACRIAPAGVTVGRVSFQVVNRSRAVRWFAIAGNRTAALRGNGRAVLSVSLLQPGRVSFVCGAPGAPSPVRRGTIEVRAARAAAQSVVIDTDMSVDDWMAILFLLQRPDVSVKAIAVSGTGVAHGEVGAENAIRLLDLAGRSGIPVAYGRDTTFPGGNAYPEAWRPPVDNMLGIPLPPPSHAPSSQPAAALLVETAASGPVEIVALGPLTDVADALNSSPSFASHVSSITISGGALDVPGNTNAGNGDAEWNFYVDPVAADIVLRSGIPTTLAPLDATTAVPYNTPFYNSLGADRRTPAARFVHDALSRQMPGSGLYFWDPFAAAVLVDPSVATFQTRSISVVTSGADAGRTISDPSGTIVHAAVHGNQSGFEDVFLNALNH
jgi:pyrimidine-specific ribonucleoside hydrolase